MRHIVDFIEVIHSFVVLPLLVRFPFVATRYAHNVLGQRVFKTEPLYTPAQGDEANPTFMQSLIGFFTKLWAPAVSDAERLGFAFMYDEAGNLLSETGTGGANSTGSTMHIYLPTATGAMPVAAIVNGQMFAVHSDHLNTPRKITNSSGQVVWQWAYSPFGEDEPTIAAKRFTSANTVPTNGSTGISPIVYNKRYEGQYYDQESGLNYNYFRTYKKDIGGYTQPDPIGLNGGWNRFGYVGGNPLGFVDPRGLDKTNYFNRSGGRSLWHGPTNGNWGGGCWSGGQYSCNGNPVGNAPPSDSGDVCYQRHDTCYVACSSNAQCRSSCDSSLVKDLKALPEDPLKWPQPPKADAVNDSRIFREDAIGRYQR